jgi:hypothetical protein
MNAVHQIAELPDFQSHSGRELLRTKEHLKQPTPVNLVDLSRNLRALSMKIFQAMRLVREVDEFFDRLVYMSSTFRTGN